MATTAQDKPYAVVEVVRSSELASHYEHLAATVHYDGTGLRDMARRIRAEGSSETVIDRKTSRVAAEGAAKIRNTANSLPGVFYRAEYIDED
jgi:hypothetical protein